MEDISSGFCARLEMPSAQLLLHHGAAHRCLEPAVLHQWGAGMYRRRQLPVSEFVECARAQMRRQDKSAGGRVCAAVAWPIGSQDRGHQLLIIKMLTSSKRSVRICGVATGRLLCSRKPKTSVPHHCYEEDAPVLPHCKADQ